MVFSGFLRGRSRVLGPLGGVAAIPSQGRLPCEAEAGPLRQSAAAKRWGVACSQLERRHGRVIPTPSGIQNLFP